MGTVCSSSTPHLVVPKNTKDALEDLTQYFGVPVSTIVHYERVSLGIHGDEDRLPAFVLASATAPTAPIAEADTSLEATPEPADGRRVARKVRFADEVPTLDELLPLTLTPLDEVGTGSRTLTPAQPSLGERGPGQNADASRVQEHVATLTSMGFVALTTAAYLMQVPVLLQDIACTWTLARRGRLSETGSPPPRPSPPSRQQTELWRSQSKAAVVAFVSRRTYKKRLQHLRGRWSTLYGRLPDVEPGSVLCVPIGDRVSAPMLTAAVCESVSPSTSTTSAPPPSTGSAFVPGSGGVRFCPSKALALIRAVLMSLPMPLMPFLCSRQLEALVSMRAERQSQLAGQPAGELRGAGVDGGDDHDDVNGEHLDEDGHVQAASPPHSHTHHAHGLHHHHTMGQPSVATALGLGAEEATPPAHLSSSSAGSGMPLAAAVVPAWSPEEMHRRARRILLDEFARMDVVSFCSYQYLLQLLVLYQDDVSVGEIKDVLAAVVREASPCLLRELLQLVVGPAESSDLAGADTDQPRKRHRRRHAQEEGVGQDAAANTTRTASGADGVVETIPPEGAALPPPPAPPPPAVLKSGEAAADSHSPPPVETTAVREPSVPVAVLKSAVAADASGDDSAQNSVTPIATRLDDVLKEVEAEVHEAEASEASEDQEDGAQPREGDALASHVPSMQSVNDSDESNEEGSDGDEPVSSAESVRSAAASKPAVAVGTVPEAMTGAMQRASSSLTSSSSLSVPRAAIAQEGDQEAHEDDSGEAGSASLSSPPSLAPPPAHDGALQPPSFATEPLLVPADSAALPLTEETTDASSSEDEEAVQEQEEENGQAVPTADEEDESTPQLEVPPTPPGGTASDPVEADNASLPAADASAAAPLRMVPSSSSSSSSSFSSSSLAGSDALPPLARPLSSDVDEAAQAVAPSQDPPGPIVGTPKQTAGSALPSAALLRYGSAHSTPFSHLLADVSPVKAYDSRDASDSDDHEAWGAALQPLDRPAPAASRAEPPVVTMSSAMQPPPSDASEDEAETTEDQDGDADEFDVLPPSPAPPAPPAPALPPRPAPSEGTVDDVPEVVVVHQSMPAAVGRAPAVQTACALTSALPRSPSTESASDDAPVYTAARTGGEPSAPQEADASPTADMVVAVRKTRPQRSSTAPLAPAPASTTTVPVPVLGALAPAQVTQHVDPVAPSHGPSTTAFRASSAAPSMVALLGAKQAFLTGYTPASARAVPVPVLVSRPSTPPATAAAAPASPSDKDGEEADEAAEEERDGDTRQNPTPITVTQPASDQSTLRRQRLLQEMMDSQVRRGVPAETASNAIRELTSLYPSLRTTKAEAPRASRDQDPAAAVGLRETSDGTGTEADDAALADRVTTEMASLRHELRTLEDLSAELASERDAQRETQDFLERDRSATVALMAQRCTALERQMHEAQMARRHAEARLRDLEWREETSRERQERLQLQLTAANDTSARLRAALASHPV